MHSFSVAASGKTRTMWARVSRSRRHCKHHYPFYAEEKQSLQMDVVALEAMANLGRRVMSARTRSSRRRQRHRSSRLLGVRRPYQAMGCARAEVRGIGVAAIPVEEPQPGGPPCGAGGRRALDRQRGEARGRRTPRRARRLRPRRRKRGEGEAARTVGRVGSGVGGLEFLACERRERGGRRGAEEPSSACAATSRVPRPHRPAAWRNRCRGTAATE